MNGTRFRKIRSPLIFGAVTLGAICVGDIPKEALNNRLKWAESLKPHL